ncbi:MAG: hypothetical protein FJ404_03035 [Verrucomicrobia bacterium]|nr:hypothetical protein [Verrucomicrobiota bacterium]
MALFGFLTLGFQLVTVRWLGICLGLDALGVLLGHGLFMVSMGLGAWISDAPWLNLRPARAVALWAAVLGVWSVASPWIIPGLSTWIASAAGWGGGWADWWKAWPGLLVAQLPGAVACGALFPSVDRGESARFEAAVDLPEPVTPRPSLSKGYASWMTGAALASLASIWCLVRWVDLEQAFWGLGILALALAISMLPGFSWPRSDSNPAQKLPAARELSVRAHARRSPAAGLFVAWALGLFGGGHQLVLVRLLGEYLEGTFLTYGVVTCTALLAASTGAWLAVRGGWTSGTKVPYFWMLSVALTPLMLIPASTVLEMIRTSGGLGSVLAAEFGVVWVVLGPGALLMGAWFARTAQEAGNSPEVRFGRWYGMNLIGVGAGGWLFLGLIAAAWGMSRALVILVVCALGFVCAFGQTFSRVWSVSVIAGCALLWSLPDSAWPVRRAPSGEKTLEQFTGFSGTASVTEDAQGRRTLRVNRRFQMGGTAVTVAQQRQADIPLLLHPAPKNALFLGVGTGITARRAQVYPRLSSDAVELLPEVLKLRHWFDSATARTAPEASISFHAGDARRWVATAAQRYDVVIGDLFHPGLDGVAGLYSRDHFQRVQRLLSPTGLFCQWLPVFQMDERLLQLVTRTFLDVFPQAQAWILHFNVDLPVLALVAGAPASRETQRWNVPLESSLASALRATGFASAHHLGGCFAAGPDALRAWVGPGPLNTDVRPFVSVWAPRVRFAKPQEPGQLLVSLLRRWGNPHASDSNSETWRFHEARDLYLEGLLVESEKNLDQAMDHYLRSAATSLFFTPAYARCVETIRVTAAVDRGRAKQWFDRLEQVRPDQPLARRLLGPLFSPETR